MAGVEDRVDRSWSATADRLSSRRAPAGRGDNGGADDEEDESAVPASGLQDRFEDITNPGEVRTAGYRAMINSLRRLSLMMRRAHLK